MTWYCIQDDGLVLTMTASKRPTIIALGAGGWRPTLAKAIEECRSGLAATVASATRELDDARAKLDAFERNVRAAGLVVERGGPML